MPMTTIRFAKERMKAIHDRSILRREFYPGDKVLLYSSRLHIFPGKLRSKWTGPYTVKFAYPHGAVILLNEKNGHEFKVNGQRVKHFYDQWQR